MSELPPLPNGFVLDNSSSTPPLPEGFKLDGAQRSAPVSAYGLGAAALTGLGKGTAALAGMPADAAAGMSYYRDKYIANPIAEALGFKPISDEKLNYNVIKDVIGSGAFNKYIQGVTGEYHKPQNTAEKVTETAASFVPAAVVAPGGVATNALRYGVIPGAASELAGMVPGVEGTKWEPWARSAAAVGASLFNPGRIANPLPVNAARQHSLDVLHNEGITSLTAGQRTGSEPLRYFESAVSAAPMAGHGVHRIQSEGQHQFTEAAVRRAGAGPDASPEVLGANQRRLGNEFEQLSARNNMVPDNRFITDIAAAIRDYRNVPQSQQRAIVQGYIDDIVQHVNNGHMPGPQYQEMRSRLSRQADSLRQSDPTLSDALRNMRNALDEAMGRSISPADREAWDTARREYSAQKVLEKAASRAGEATAEGQITPPNLRNTVSAENRGAYARGEGQFAELARAGAHVMTPLPNSGTAQRHNVFSLLNSATLGVVPAVTGRVVMSPPVQYYLSGRVPGQQMAGRLLGAEAPRNLTAQQLMMIEALQRPTQ